MGLLSEFEEASTFYTYFFGDPQGNKSFAQILFGFNDWGLTPFERGWFR